MNNKKIKDLKKIHKLFNSLYVERSFKAYQTYRYKILELTKALDWGFSEEIQKPIINCINQFFKTMDVIIPPLKEPKKRLTRKIINRMADDFLKGDIIIKKRDLYLDLVQPFFPVYNEKRISNEFFYGARKNLTLYYKSTRVLSFENKELKRILSPLIMERLERLDEKKLTDILLTK
jgi:hypothetical protein